MAGDVQDTVLSGEGCCRGDNAKTDISIVEDYFRSGTKY